MKAKMNSPKTSGKSAHVRQDADWEKILSMVDMNVPAAKDVKRTGEAKPASRAKAAKAGTRVKAKPLRPTKPIKEVAARASGSAPSVLSHFPHPAVLTLTGVDPQGRALLPMPMAPGRGKPESVAARSILPVTQSDIGRQALVCFENGDARLPIIMGWLQPNIVALDPKVLIEAGQELTLQAGAASITLSKDGRIVIRGTDLLSRASGSNRIKGGSVQIN